jgi:hypothetical protein
MARIAKSISSKPAPHADKVSLPLRGHNLYIGDRVRDTWMRSEKLKDFNTMQDKLNAQQREHYFEEESLLQKNM